MSGTGKSSVIEKLQYRGFTAIDTDYGDWKELSQLDRISEWILSEDKLYDLLSKPLNSPLFISGCCSNQTKFYKLFDYKVLLSAPIEIIFERIMKRTKNPYGKTDKERVEIAWNYENIQPLLKKGIDFEFDTETMSVKQIADTLTELALN